MKLPLLALLFLQLPPTPICPTGQELDTECAADAEADYSEAVAAARRAHSNRMAAARATCNADRAECYDAYDACMLIAGSNTSAQITCLGTLEDCVDDADDIYNATKASSEYTRDTEIATAESSYLIAVGLCCYDP